MVDFYGALKQARGEVRNEETCDLDTVRVLLDDMEAAYDELSNEHSDLVGTLKEAHFVKCRNPRSYHQWVETKLGETEFDEDPNKRYCLWCGSEIVDGKCSWAPEGD